MTVGTCCAPCSPPQVTNLWLSNNGGVDWVDLPDAHGIVGHDADGFGGTIWTFCTATGTYIGSLAAGTYTFALKYRGTPHGGNPQGHDDWVTKNIQILVLPQ